MYSSELCGNELRSRSARQLVTACRCQFAGVGTQAPIALHRHLLPLGRFWGQAARRGDIDEQQRSAMQSLLKYVPGKGPEDAAVPPNNTFITTTDGVKIAWERHGRLGGPVVVLVHGWSGECAEMSVSGLQDAPWCRPPAATRLTLVAVSCRRLPPLFRLECAPAGKRGVHGLHFRPTLPRRERATKLGKRCHAARLPATATAAACHCQAPLRLVVIVPRHATMALLDLVPAGPAHRPAGS